MSVFSNYSRYYDLLYGDKDYQAEAEFVDALIQSHRPGAKSILDLGCGTGGHDLLLAEKGYRIIGVDSSKEMVKIARSNLSDHWEDVLDIGVESSIYPTSGDVDFRVGDIRTERLSLQFDVVISLFHVISYLTTEEDLNAALCTAKAHLKQGGILLFDCWYGPAVIAQKPSVRIKKIEDERISAVRIAEPVMHVNENRVDVNYTLLVRDKESGAFEEIRETHRMRYWFMPEVRSMLKETGFELLEAKAWMKDEEPSLESWNVNFVAIAK